MILLARLAGGPKRVMLLKVNKGKRTAIVRMDGVSMVIPTAILLW